MNKIFKVIKMARITYSSQYAMKVANDYWQNTTITHSSMNKEHFDFYYNEIVKMMKVYMLGLGKAYIGLTKLFSVCQIDLAGFFVKNSQLESLAVEIGFTIKRYDSWANYRSHWVLTKVK